MGEALKESNKKETVSPEKLKSLNASFDEILRLEAIVDKFSVDFADYDLNDQNDVAFILSQLRIAEEVKRLIPKIYSHIPKEGISLNTSELLEIEKMLEDTKQSFTKILYSIEDVMSKYEEVINVDLENSDTSAKLAQDESYKNSANDSSYSIEGDGQKADKTAPIKPEGDTDSAKDIDQGKVVEADGEDFEIKLNSGSILYEDNSRNSLKDPKELWNELKSNYVAKGITADKIEAFYIRGFLPLKRSLKVLGGKGAKFDEVTLYEKFLDKAIAFYQVASVDKESNIADEALPVRGYEELMEDLNTKVSYVDSVKDAAEKTAPELYAAIIHDIETIKSRPRTDNSNEDSSVLEKSLKILDKKLTELDKILGSVTLDENKDINSDISEVDSLVLAVTEVYKKIPKEILDSRKEVTELDALLERLYKSIESGNKVAESSLIFQVKVALDMLKEVDELQPYLNEQIKPETESREVHLVEGGIASDVVESERASESYLILKSQFLDYFEKNKEKIKAELSKPEGRDLNEIIYHDFYAHNVNGKRFDSDNPGFSELVQEYEQKTAQVRKKILQMTADSAGVVYSSPNQYWINVSVQGFTPESKIGRLYINTSPESTHKVFEDLLMASLEGNIHCQIKMPAEGNKGAFERVDKTVFYFDAKEDKKVLEIIDLVQKLNPNSFETGTPKFSADIFDSNGQKMPGIGFGEEPNKLQSGELTSFGLIRAKLLADIIREAEALGVDVYSADFNFEEAYRSACVRYHVDPENPAFNINQSESSFVELKKRITARVKTESSVNDNEALNIKDSNINEVEIKTGDTPYPEESTLTKSEQETKAEQHSARLETREAKAKMKDVQAKYNDVLKEYYLNRSTFDVARDAISRTWSTGEYLPKEVKQKLNELQREFSSLSTEYENALKYELDLRELRRAGMGGNLEVSSLSADGKLVETLLDDRLSVGVFKKEQAAIEQAKAERDVEKSKTLTGRVMVGIKKHPGKLKALGLLTASSLGFATGGLLGLAGGATRFAASVALGGLTAKKVYELAQSDVDKNKNYLDALMVPRSKEEVEGLTREARTKLLRIANAQLEQAKLRQVAKAATAAALVGGTTRGAFAAVDSLITPTPAPAVMPYPDSGLGAEAQSAIEAAAEREMEDMATASLSPEAVPAISSIDLIDKIELDTSSAIAGNDTVINDVKLNGVGLSSIDSAQTILLLSEIKEQAGDILWDAPRLNKFELENLINSRLESKFGSQDWWPQGSGIKVEIGSIELAEDLQRDREVLTEMGQTDFGSVDAEDAESVREYQIKQGDNLTNIVKRELAAKLEGVPAARREAVLANLFERINNNPELKTELGIKADVNKIYSGDKLDLGVLERELEKETLVDNFRKSGALGVESDSATKNVPIKVTETALERGTKITISDGLGERAYVEEKPVLPKPVPAGIKEFSPSVSPEVYQNLKLPTTLPVTGQYMDNVGINDQIAKIFQGGPNSFEREVMNAVNDFDNRTYDPLNRLFGGYTSPYMLLGDMSLEKYYNYIDMPNAELRQELASLGIKYETFVSWSDKITELQNRFPHTEKTTIGDLMKRAVLEDRLAALKK